MRHLDLFSGIGGFALAAQRVWGPEHEVVAFAELDPYCRAVLRKHWPDVRIYDDVRYLKNRYYENIDLLTGGFPCQPFSAAGQQRGEDDNRYLWPEMLRVIERYRPRWVLGENVPGIIDMALDQVLTDLENAGYEARPIGIPACGVDAPHRRERIWIIAHGDGDGRSGILRETGQGKKGAQLGEDLNGQSPGDGRKGTAREDVADAQGEQRNGGLQTRRRREGYPDRRGDVPDPDKINGYLGGHGAEPLFKRESPALQQCQPWPPEPGVGRVVDGFPGRMDRLRAFGNSIVPGVAEGILGYMKIIDDSRPPGDTKKKKAV
jgi:DNA (cytosine-5)-methyltransferase 1